MKSFNFRNTDQFLRNSYYSLGKYDMPVVYKQEIDTTDFSLIGYHNTKLRERNNLNKAVHFYTDDYKFNCVWTFPEKYISRLAQYKYVLSPDFSIYTNMPLAIQIYNTFRRRWCSAFWQENEMTVIPAIAWGDERSFEFCFTGVEKGSTVAVSTLGCKKYKETYLRGFAEMCRLLQPEKVICYCKPFVEMFEMADVVAVPYEGVEMRLQKQRLDKGVS